MCVCVSVSVVEIKSDATLPEAVETLADHNLLSAPVVDVKAPEGATWIDRYIGIVEFAGIVVWVLQQVSFSTYFNLLFTYMVIGSKQSVGRQMA